MRSPSTSPRSPSGQPVISVDTKKKELVGDFKNAGREWHPQGRPPAAGARLSRRGKAIPYGIYDLSANAGWVSVGSDHDTPEFAVESIYCWWRQMGRKTYPEAHELLITADGGGSNGSRVRLWKVALQRMADATGLKISVCHFPPGTSKWNDTACSVTSPATGAAARKPRGHRQPDRQHHHHEGLACARCARHLMSIRPESRSRMPR